jgi:hypothetical protein
LVDRFAVLVGESMSGSQWMDGCVFTIGFLMVRRLTEVTTLLDNIALCLFKLWYFANFATWLVITSNFCLLNFASK